MPHTFFEKNSNYIVVENFDIDQFIVEVSWSPESTQLELVFDPSEDYFEELQEKIRDGVWEHFVLKAAAYYDGKEMGSAYLGSIVAEDPATYITDDPDGSVDDLVREAVEEARNEAVRMLDRLKEDFLDGA
jgi:hypothetical protein